VGFGNSLTPDPGVAQAAKVGQPPPDGFNVAAAGSDDPVLQADAAEGYATIPPASCAAWARWQETMLTQFYRWPMAAQNFDVFVRKGLSAPTAEPTSVPAYPVYFINTT
jgi:hypothetical protein